jgi:hypothetical protein
MIELIKNSNLKFKKQEAILNTEVSVTAANPHQSKTDNTEVSVIAATPYQSRTGSYVNLECIVADHSPLVMEYLDNEITNLKRKLSNLEKERSLVAQLFQVVQNAKGSNP